MARILTVKDLELFYSGAPGHPFLSLGDIAFIAKEAGAVTTDLFPQFFNYVYGAQIWYQINMEANAFAALPKTTWPRTGWRVIKSLSTTPSDIGIAQTGAIPSAVRPNVETVKTPPKVEALSFEVSEVIESLASMSEDDIYGNVDQLRNYYGVEFAKQLNKQILYKAIGNDVNSSEASAGYKLESIDRIVSGYSESQLNGGTAGNEVGAAVDVYGIDRHSAESWADAVVLHNNGTLRSITDDLIRELIQATTTKGAHPTMFLTGYDTAAAIYGLYMTFVRYLPMGETQVQFGLEGVKTAKGINAGVKVASLYNIPMIQAVDTPTDDNGISRLYLLDTSDYEGNGLPRLALSVVRPIEYFESRDFVLLNKFVIKGVYRFVGETIARGLAYQGKLRDLTT